MDPVVFLFPLPHLPSKASTNVLKTMETIDLIAFSLVSKYTKSLVVSINFISRWRSHICIHQTFDLILPLQGYRIIIKLNKRANPRSDRNSKLTVADTIEVVKDNYDGTNAIYTWTNPRFGIREWIKHLKNVTNRATIDKICFHPESEPYNIDSVAKTIRGLGVYQLVVADSCSKPYSQLIHGTIFTPWIRLNQNPYPDRESFQKVLMSNNNLIDISFAPPISLEELLAINSKHLRLGSPAALAIGTLNKFLKLWMAGRFNTNLKYILLFYREEGLPDRSMILKGISHHVVDRALDREFREHIPQIKPLSVMKGGYDIRGANGMTATLFFERRSVEMFIWR